MINGNTSVHVAQINDDPHYYQLYHKSDGI